MSSADEPNRAAAVGGGSVPLSKVALYCLSILSIATAVIHFAVAGTHFQEYWLFGVFMLVCAWLQLLWAVVAIARPGRWLLWGGTLLNVAVIAVYVVTRTVGDIVGPTPNAIEPFGFGDGLCTILEAIVAGGCMWLLFGRLHRSVTRQGLVITSASTGAITAALLSVALVAGGPEMVMTMSAAPVAGRRLRAPPRLGEASRDAAAYAHGGSCAERDQAGDLIAGRVYHHA